MRSRLVKPRYRPGTLAATRAALPSVLVLPVRAHADVLFPRYQTDGITRDIIDALARMPDLLVISPSTALQYRSTVILPRQLGDELNIDYVLSVHVVRVDDQLTFTQDLFDARSGQRIWRHVEKSCLGRLYEFETHVVARVINSILPSLRDAEVMRAFANPSSNLTAYHYAMRALAKLEVLTRQNLEDADGYLQAARSIDPTYAPAFAWGARIASLRIGQGWTSDRPATGRTALDLASKAIKLDPEDATALATAGHLQSFLMQDYPRALSLIERALRVCPNNALAWGLASPTLSYMGRCSEALEHAEHAIWLSPMDPMMFQFSSSAGLACHLLGEHDRAITWLRAALVESPEHTSVLKYLMASLVAVGQIREARDLKDRLLALERDFGANGEIRSPFKDPVQLALFRTRMRTAGIGTSGARSVKMTMCGMMRGAT